MTLQLLVENISNPALLFFMLGILAVLAKSDLSIPESSSKFISLYLLFAIGFKGGQELSHETIDTEVILSILFGVALSVIIPVYCFLLLKRKLSVFDSGAIASAYGSVSAVTFVTAVTYLESHQLTLHGHMVAVMALMESPSIIMGILLISLYSKDHNQVMKKRDVIHHSLTNGSVFIILGSLIIGYLADSQQAEGIKPFTNDLFKGFLAIFLLDMGLICGKKLKSFFSYGWYPFLFAVMIPLFNGTITAVLSSFVTSDLSNRFMLSVLAASASYIAVPSAMKLSVPQANPGLYLPMALAVTFPVNITIGMPLYYAMICIG